MNRLTNSQEKVIKDIKDGILIYVFPLYKGGCSYGYSKEDTSCRLYLTLTCRSLIRKGICKHWLVDEDLVLILQEEI